ncbi:MAG TPA: hypothetical protein VFI76_02585, partial [Terrimicrobiaceae bacterium]|nr:hypothetical protein [Terrimicrobiaceae bacterium]
GWRMVRASACGRSTRTKSGPTTSSRTEPMKQGRSFLGDAHAALNIAFGLFSDILDSAADVAD